MERSFLNGVVEHSKLVLDAYNPHKSEMSEDQLNDFNVLQNSYDILMNHIATKNQSIDSGV